MTEFEMSRVVPRMLAAQQLAFWSAAAPFAYLLSVMMGALPPGPSLWIHALGAPVLLGICGVAVPYALIRRGVASALASRPGDAPGARLTRLLILPRKLELLLLASYLGGVLLYTGWPVVAYGARGAVVLLSLLCFGLLSLLTAIHQKVGFEEALHPLALEEFHRTPQGHPTPGGFLWPRLTWYLPYAFALFVLGTLLVNATLVNERAASGFEQRLASANPAALSGAQVAALARDALRGSAESLIVPLVCLGGFLLLTAVLAAWRIARHQQEGALALQEAIQSIASGKPILPGWVTTDELGELSRQTAAAFEELKSFSLSLNESARMLGQSAEELGVSNSKQNEVLSLQAAALQETQVTAQEIKQTSLLAAQKAEGVLKQTERADEISRSGEAAIEQSLNGLKDIQQVVTEMATRIKALDERARQIANITTTVKDLADQSNMLALNAAIEAVRSGEHGKGFGVVAREIRNLADQSIQATNHVREILQDISEAIRTTVSITERGSEKVEGSVAQVRAFGDNIRQLSGIVRDNAAAVRQISAAVTQQNAGIGQIFQAVNDLTKMMDDTMQRLRATDGATAMVRSVAERVSGFVGNYGWQELGNPGKQGPQDGKETPGVKT